MRYCCHVWDVLPNCYLDILVNLQKQVCKAVVPELDVCLEPLVYCQNKANPSLFYSYYIAMCSLELAELTSILYSDRSHDVSVIILDVKKMSMPKVSFLVDLYIGTLSQKNVFL